MLGTTEIIILVGVAALIFGAAAVPKLARALGSAQGEFHKAKRMFDEEVESARNSVTTHLHEDTDIRRAARGLGIDVEGRSDTELRDLIRRKLG